MTALQRACNANLSNLFKLSDKMTTGQMETEKEMIKSNTRNSRLKTGAIVCLVALSLYIGWQLLNVYRTRHQLTSPLIPRSLIREINKQFFFKAIVASVILLIAGTLYFFKRHLIVIVLVILMLIAGRYIYI
jgi:hypothetical protein